MFLQKAELSPSLLAADFGKIAEQLSEIEKAGCKFLHLDVMDGIFVPNISFGIPVIESIRKNSNMIFDVHLMIANPERYIENFYKAGADIINIHAEAVEDLPKVLNLIKSFGVKAAVTIKPNTPVSYIENVLNMVDMVLVMSVEPGFGGQKFMPEQLKKVKLLSKIRQRKGYDYNIEIDGGISLDNVEDVVKAGANIVVAGSAVFGAENLTERFNQFDKIFKDNKLNNKVIIFASAQIDDYDFYEKYIDEEDIVVCCDGGMKHTKNLGIIPHFIIGDFDSASFDLIEYYKNIDVKFKEFPTKKDETDMELAVNHVINELNPKEVVIFGGIGSRIDHTLANLHILERFMKKGINAKLINEKNCVQVTDKSLIIEGKKGNLLSIIPMGLDTVISLKGFEYPLESAYIAHESPIGISNIVTSEKAEIIVEKGMIYIIESND